MPFFTCFECFKKQKKEIKPTHIRVGTIAEVSLSQMQELSVRSNPELETMKEPEPQKPRNNSFA